MLEQHTPTYGLMTPVNTYTLLELQYGKIIRDVRAAADWPTRLGYVFKPPGWQPERR